MKNFFKEIFKDVLKRTILFIVLYILMSCVLTIYFFIDTGEFTQSISQGFLYPIMLFIFIITFSFIGSFMS